MQRIELVQKFSELRHNAGLYTALEVAVQVGVNYKSFWRHIHQYVECPKPEYQIGSGTRKYFFKDDIEKVRSYCQQKGMNLTDSE